MCRQSLITKMSLILLAVLGVIVTACGGASSGGSGSNGSTQVAAVIKGLDNPFFQAMQRGIQDEAGTVGVSVTIQAATSITDTTGQADKLQALAGQNYGCYIVNPISGTNLVQALAPIAQAGKPIINIDNPISAQAAQAAGIKISTYIGTDNVSAGQQAANEMAKLLPTGGKVALIGGIAGDVTSQQRLQGFSQGIPATIQIVQTVAADWDRQKALTAAGDILRAHPDLKGFFVANDDMALGVVRAIADAGKQGQVKVVSVDGIQDALKSIQAGQLSATVSQYPYTIGAMGVEACKAALAGKTLPAKVTAPVLVVTSDNVAQALANFPKPFSSYVDPFQDLLK
ncbi:substrate-binding domain-containing protein [Thermogemmatispora carboxidivorans]|uniref:sugar ABC transporter substrate-binding protein n=1 Tax=Thermogemmatispora carboxidivorans TaxID=1382306 RepID=UPI00069BB22D|nr:substrate-binding domain-containing protein [Thermogemmatispora carboxidivorans]